MSRKLIAYRVHSRDPTDEAELNEQLLSHPVFRHLDDVAREQVLHSSQIVQRPANRRIFRASETSSNVYFILSGVVRIYHRHRDGREILAKLLIAPALFGEIEVIAAVDRMASADTLSAARLLYIPANVFREILNSHLAFAHAVLRDVSQRFCLAGSNERDLAFNRVTPRLARLLADYSAVNAAVGSSQHVHLSQADLARDLAVTRKAVVQSISSLIGQGAVRKDKEGYVVTDAQKLAEIIDGTLTSVHHSNER